MSVAITCGQCGFLYGFSDEEVRYTGPACPECRAYGARVEVEVDEAARSAPHVAPEWFVVDALRGAVAGPFSSPASATIWITRNRLWDHPRGPLDVVHGPVTSDDAGAEAPARTALDYRHAEWPGDPRFWTPDRVLSLGLLEASLPL